MPLSSDYFSSLLKVCCDTRNLTQAKKLHCRIIKTVKNPETFLFNNLVNAYSRLGSLKHASNVFDQITQPNLFSWNAILSAYSKAGNIVQVQKSFNLMSVRDGVSWNCLISAYAGRGLVAESVHSYNMMLRDGTRNLNRITFSTMLILSSNAGYIHLGRQVHGHIMKFGFSEYVFVGSPLVDMYSKAGLIGDARLVFNEMPERNLVLHNTMVTGLLRCGLVEESKMLLYNMTERDSISWTTMITGLTQNGLEADAVSFFREMVSEGLEIDQFTYGSVLTACGSILAVDQGREIHAFAMKTNYIGNIFVGSALVDMYCKCKHIHYAKRIFNRMVRRNVVSWTAMLVGYGQNGFGEDAVRAFHDMQRNGIKPDDITLGSVVSSCANLASLEEGLQFHCLAFVSGFVSCLTVSNALISLYGKCGNVEDSSRVFGEMNHLDEVSWTALISGYAQFGKAYETIGLFEKMLALGFKPDGVTFIGVLSACSRAGLVEKGEHYFESMLEEHQITPSADHYTCMIDLLSRSGRLQEAKSFINNMPFPPDAIGWSTLLSSCRFQGNLEIGKWAAEALMELEPQSPASYVLLTSMYAATGKWDDVAQLRKGMRERGVKKEPGFSWIKYKNKVHFFSADDHSSPYLDQIYAELESLNSRITAEGYFPDVNSILHDVEDSMKIKMLNLHSERLAIAFGLIFIPSNLPIKVVKNLRVCGDCHNATKYISKVTGREILVRDAVRFHLFKDGSCSCGDFW
ncbi:hypothetical protein SAY86_026818 [Trapa natans]|uniref:DYW domain-containing protein n=1 Tax=Trapa natans TaxID=22666 RepID=A0AAN7KJ61_TRANT|nr:hypothetical protein SAY86_026818 [Trapa natans]